MLKSSSGSVAQACCLRDQVKCWWHKNTIFVLTGLSLLIELVILMRTGSRFFKSEAQMNIETDFSCWNHSCCSYWPFNISDGVNNPQSSFRTKHLFKGCFKYITCIWKLRNYPSSIQFVNRCFIYLFSLSLWLQLLSPSDDDALQISRPFYTHSVISSYYTIRREELTRLAKWVVIHKF